MNFELNSRRKFQITLALALILGGILLWVFYFLSSRVLNQEALMRDLRFKIASFDLDQLQAQRFEKIAGQYQKELNSINNFFVPSDSPVEFIETLEELARSAGVKLTLGIQNPGKEDFKFSLLASGGEQNLRKFLSMVELLPYLITLGDLNYDKTKELNSSNTVTRLSFNLSVKIK